MAFALYEQATGRFAIFDFDDGGQERCVWETIGWAGRGIHRNRPESEAVVGYGPLPGGRYHIRLAPNRRFRAPAFRLDPLPANVMHGRSGFWLHGGSESHGCIILQLAQREAVEHFMPKLLEVVPGP